MARVHDSIEITAPVEQVFDQWLRFEDYPCFMVDIAEVRPVGDGRMHWRGCINGEMREWEAEVIENVPGRRLAWRDPAHLNDAVVDMVPTEFGTTWLSVDMEVEPSEPTHDASAYLEAANRRVHLNLERFREHVLGNLEPVTEREEPRPPLH
jgi:uncharacterized membrane protein